uniref:MAT1-2-1 n=2 Tax=Phialocephala fortinii species complex TaxID=576134 RepID=D9J2B8_9HELO|nr:MAT1-2-1 [Phialocephala letzii]ADJ38476.1 MAT1-2-1 [Phialocephala europaea]
MAAAATPINFIVHSNPIMPKEQFNKFYAMAEIQITSSNRIAALQASSWFALSEKQKSEFSCRYSNAVHDDAVLLVDKHLNRNQMYIGPKQEIEYFSAALEAMDDTTLSNLCSQIVPVFGDGSVPMYPPAQHCPAAIPLHQGGQQTQASGPPPYNNQLNTLIPVALLRQRFNAQGGAAGQGLGTGLGATTSITVTQTVTTPNPRPTKTGRPPNSWILFRADNHDRVKAENPGLGNNVISGLISTMWSDASAGVRNHYAMLAELAREIHRAKNPAYKYKPRKSSEIKRRQARGTARADFISSAELETSFAETDEVFTRVNGELNKVENSTGLLGADFDATYSQRQGNDLLDLYPGTYPATEVDFSYSYLFH